MNLGLNDAVIPGAIIYQAKEGGMEVATLVLILRRVFFDPMGEPAWQARFSRNRFLGQPIVGGLAVDESHFPDPGYGHRDSGGGVGTHCPSALCESLAVMQSLGLYYGAGQTRGGLSAAEAAVIPMRQLMAKAMRVE